MKSTPLSFKKVPTLRELKQGFPDIQGLFFDMDGTIFNTESYHAEALIKMGRKYKIRPPHSSETVHELMMGKADYLVFEIIKDWEGVPKHWTLENFVNEKNQLLIEIFEKENPSNYFPHEVKELLSEAKASGSYLALVTSSEKVITKQLLRITQLEHFFNLVLTRDDCPKHKPDPWPYLRAMEISKLSKSEVLIFEDSSVGLTAAVDSGAHVIKVEWH